MKPPENENQFSRALGKLGVSENFLLEPAKSYDRWPKCHTPVVSDTLYIGQQFLAAHRSGRGLRLSCKSGFPGFKLAEGWHVAASWAEFRLNPAIVGPRHGFFGTKHANGLWNNRRSGVAFRLHSRVDTLALNIPSLAC